MLELQKKILTIPTGNGQAVETFRCNDGFIVACYEDEDHGKLKEIARLLFQNAKTG